MDPFLVQLLEVGEVDARLAVWRDDVRRHERMLAAADEAAAKADAAVKALEERLAALRRDEQRHQADLERAMRLKASAQSALEQGLGDPVAAERQIARCEETIDEAETAILEILDARDQATPALADAKAAVEQANARAAQAHEEHEPALVTLESEMSAASHQRTSLVGALPREVAGTYGQLMRTKGSAVSHVVDKACAGCGHDVPLQRLSDVRQGRLVSCSGCGRWLAPPQAEPVG